MRWLIVSCVALLSLGGLLMLRKDDAEVARGEPELTDRSAPSQLAPSELRESSQRNPFVKASNTPPGVDAADPVALAAPSAALSVDAASNRAGCNRTQGQGHDIPATQTASNQSEQQAPSFPTADLEDSSVDKQACYAAARTLREAWSIFDITSTQAVWYALVLPTHGGSVLRDSLAPSMCLGNQLHHAGLVPEFELVAVTSESNARVFLAEGWVSDGTVVSPLAQSDYSRIVHMLAGRQRQGIGEGRNVSRAVFDKRLQSGAYAKMAGDEYARKQGEVALRRAQQGLAVDDC